MIIVAASRLLAKQLVVQLFFLGLAILSLSAPVHAEENLRELKSNFDQLMLNSRSLLPEEDVQRAIEFDRRSREAFSRRDYSEAAARLRDAIALLKNRGKVSAVSVTEMPIETASTSGGCGSLPTELKKHEQSPFGIHLPYILSGSDTLTKTAVPDVIADIGIKWATIFAPDLAAVVPELTRRGINIMAKLGAKGNKLPYNIVDYERSVRAFVRTNCGSVKYWQVGNEPDLTGSGAEDYAKLLKSTYTVIKAECPDCKVVFGGLAFGNPALSGDHSERAPGATFLRELLKAGGGGYFDVFDMHYPGTFTDYRDMKESVTLFSNLLANSGAGLKPIWLTEMSTYSGSPKESKIRGYTQALPIQSEAEQASGLIKRYVYGIRLGISKMFWNLLVERHQFGGVSNSYYDNVGLMHNSRNAGLSHKKLAYFSYKKMIDLFDGADLSSVTAEKESDNLMVISFRKNGHPVWIAWADGAGQKMITLDNSTAALVRVTHAVPSFKSGKDIPAYSNVFLVEHIKRDNGKLTIQVGSEPIVIEEE